MSQLQWHFVIESKSIVVPTWLRIAIKKGSFWQVLVMWTSYNRKNLTSLQPHILFVKSVKIRYMIFCFCAFLHKQWHHYFPTWQFSIVHIVDPCEIIELWDLKNVLLSNVVKCPCSLFLCRSVKPKTSTKSFGKT